MSNKIISIFAIDDDKTFLLFLEKIVSLISNELNMVILLSTYTELPSDLSVNDFNLFFVDVEMPELDGFTGDLKFGVAGDRFQNHMWLKSRHISDSVWPGFKI